jgi:hypothetical protein
VQQEVGIGEAAEAIEGQGVLSVGLAGDPAGVPGDERHQEAILLLDETDETWVVVRSEGPRPAASYATHELPRPVLDAIEQRRPVAVPLRSTKTRSAVDHDLGDIAVLEQPVDRAIPQDVVGDVLDELGLVRRGERRALDGQGGVELVLDIGSDRCPLRDTVE